MPFITQVLHVPQVLLSAYGLYVSYISITNLRQYEEKSEKAAEWSSAAEHQLHKTRTTQASGAITILFSFSSSVLLIAAPNDIPSLLRFSLSPVLLLCTLFARSHVSGFWTGKAKVPFVDGYNEAISRTAELIDILKWLEYSWLGLSLVSAIVGY